MARSERDLTEAELLPKLPGPVPPPADGVALGEVHRPGMTLRRILRGHDGTILQPAWSRDGRFLATPSKDQTARIWDVARGETVAVLKHRAEVNCVAWGPDGELVTGDNDGLVSVWPAPYWRGTELHQTTQPIWCLAWSPDGRRLAGGGPGGIVHLWDPLGVGAPRTLKGHRSSVTRLCWSPDSRRLASSSYDKSVRIWRNLDRRESSQELTGHSGDADCVMWSPTEPLLASGAEDNTIRLWNADTGREVRVLEAHTGAVPGLAFSPGGELLVSASTTDEVRIWRTDTWDSVAQVTEQTAKNLIAGIAFHPHLPVLATLAERGSTVRIWSLDIPRLLGEQASDLVRYTTAKVVLVGDSGVGKTGLGWRLAHGEFKEHASTHGQQFWVVDELGTTRADGTECEAVLWDLAGQHVYRPIHAIYLDNVDASLVLFDPTNRHDPLKGAQFWLEQLKGRRELGPAVLVGARVDRGSGSLSQSDIEQFCHRYGVSGGYVATSARSGEGLDDLQRRLRDLIQWDAMVATVTTRTFKRIKEYVSRLKENPVPGEIVVSPADLRQRLEATDPGWRFSDAEMMTAIGHLETHGYVAVLTSSTGEQFVLLAPDLLATLASSIVLYADKHPRELGALDETELLRGAYPFDELAPLAEHERNLLLDAAVQRFLEHNVCFRETLDADTLLIFPGLIKQKRPLADDLDAVDDVTYVVRGRVENLYARLVVLLGYSPSFVRINQWQHQARYEMRDGSTCGFRLVEDREGEIELILYYSESMPPAGRSELQALFEQFLYRWEADVTRFAPVICPDGHRLERATALRFAREGKTSAYCSECGAPIQLPDSERASIGTADSEWIRREEAAAHLRTRYEQHLARVKGYRRSWASPRAYLSHAPWQQELATQLRQDLRDAGVIVIDSAADVGPDDHILVLDSGAYQQLFFRPDASFAADAELVRARISSGSRRLASLNADRDAGPGPASHGLDACAPGDFRDPSHHPVSLFNLVLDLYAIPLTHASFLPLRASLHEQWERTLGPPPAAAATGRSRPPTLFISYSHEDEPFKDELVSMLEILRRRGVIDAWHDRRIDGGDDWSTAIEAAITGCELAVLLLSKDFLASAFIQDQELPRLLERRRDDGLRILPILVRDCLWRSDQLAELQLLPRDGKAVVSFAPASGERDRIWTEIAGVIEAQALALRRRPN